ncbi:MAG: hypothetical protein JXQ75_08505 [Phycisphaerae bacterium]|nr:hypothetical protein [Phycisphaerae bacterium]
MRRAIRFALAALLVLVAASRAIGDAVLLKDGTLVKGTIDYQTSKRVVLAITSYTKVPIQRSDIALLAVSEDGTAYSRYADGSEMADEGLQIATLLFEHPRTHKVVSLVGAIHVGDASYYRELRLILDAHDRVLYELVTGSEDDGFSKAYDKLTSTMRRLLQLESQKAVVDYEHPPKNWVHADLSWSQLKRTLGVDRLELIPPEVQKELVKVMGLVEKYVRFAEVTHLDKLSATMLKRLLGRKMGDELEATWEQLEGRESANHHRGTMARLMDARNKKAMRVLKRELRRNKHTSFAVFYGAGHMPYFEMRLRRMGFRRLGVAWVTAWKVP